MNYKAIFFDWDGVITDSVDVKTEAFCDMFKDYGAEIQVKVKEHHLKNGGVSRFEKFKFYYKNYLGIDIDENKVAMLADEFSLLVKEKVIAAPFIEGAVETIKSEYAKGTKLFIVSGTPTGEIIDIAKAKRLFEYFTEISGSPDKKPDIVQRLLKKHNLQPKDCLFIGDAMIDYDAAKANGMDFLGIVDLDKKIDFPAGTKTSNRVCLEALQE